MRYRNAGLIADGDEKDDDDDEADVEEERRPKSRVLNSPGTLTNGGVASAGSSWSAAMGWRTSVSARARRPSREETIVPSILFSMGFQALFKDGVVVSAIVVFKECLNVVIPWYPNVL